MDNSLKFSLIKDQPLFQTLSTQDISWLSESAKFHRIGKSEKVYSEGSESNKLYLLIKGTVKLCLTSESGKLLIKSIVHQDEIFGENIFSGVNIRQDFAQAFNGEIQYLAFRKEHIFQLVMKNQAFATELTRVIANRLASLERRMENYVYKKAKARIVDFIVQTGKIKGIKIGIDECLINHGMSHKEIAYLTDTSRQTVARVLGELKRSNLIHFSARKPSKILIRNLAALQV